jgi:hypothetical protein
MRFSLFPTTEAPAEARRGLAVLADRIDSASLAEVRAVVSELVAISVSNGAAKLIDMQFDVINGSVEAVIDDHGPAARAIERARQREGSPLALLIIESLVEDWRVALGGTEIWFRMAVEPARHAPLQVGTT